jgi:hypothetical protein
MKKNDTSSEKITTISLLLDALLLYLSPISKLKISAISKDFHLLMQFFLNDTKLNLYNLFSKKYSYHQMNITHVMLPSSLSLNVFEIEHNGGCRIPISIDAYHIRKYDNFSLIQIDKPYVKKVIINWNELTLKNSELICGRPEYVNLLDFEPVHILSIDLITILTGPIIFYN